MSDPHENGDTPAAVAYTLMLNILRATHRLKPSGWTEGSVGEKDVLDLYARCLEATSGKRTTIDYTKL